MVRLLREPKASDKAVYRSVGKKPTNCITWEDRKDFTETISIDSAGRKNLSGTRFHDLRTSRHVSNAQKKQKWRSVGFIRVLLVTNDLDTLPWLASIGCN